MMPSRLSVDTIVVLIPTVAGSNIRAATTQYSKPTAEEIPELRTSAIPSRFCGSRQPVASALSRATADGPPDAGDAAGSAGITGSSCNAASPTRLAG